jgi:hypothetical protein
MIELGAFLIMSLLLVCWLLFLVDRAIEQDLPSVRRH